MTVVSENVVVPDFIYNKESWLLLLKESWGFLKKKLTPSAKQEVSRHSLDRERDGHLPTVTHWFLLNPETQGQLRGGF